MKKIIKLMVIVMVMMTGVKVSYGQNWDSRIFGVWAQTSTYKSNVYTKNISSVNITSNNKANVTVDNSITQFDLKPLPNGSLETLLPLEIKSMYGYDAKKVFIRFYNQNNQLRVVRKIYEYDRNGKILNQAQVDSVLFRRVIDKAILNAIANNPAANANTKVANGNPYSDFKPFKPVDKKLPVADSFNITNIKFETLNIDEDEDCNGKTFDYYNNKSEFFGDIKLKIYKTNTLLNADLGWIFSQYFRGNLGSSYTLELNTPKLSTESYKSGFLVTPSDFDQTRVVFFGDLLEINPTREIETNCNPETDYLLGSKNSKSYKELYLKDLSDGENFIDLKGNKNTMRIHFTIKPN